MPISVGRLPARHPMTFFSGHSLQSFRRGTDPGRPVPPSAMDSLCKRSLPVVDVSFVVSGPADLELGGAGELAVGMLIDTSARQTAAGMRDDQALFTRSASPVSAVKILAGRARLRGGNILGRDG